MEVGRGRRRWDPAADDLRRRRPRPVSPSRWSRWSCRARHRCRRRGGRRSRRPSSDCSTGRASAAAALAGHRTRTVGVLLTTIATCGSCRCWTGSRRPGAAGLPGRGGASTVNAHVDPTPMDGFPSLRVDGIVIAHRADGRRMSRRHRHPCRGRRAPRRRRAPGRRHGRQRRPSGRSAGDRASARARSPLRSATCPVRVGRPGSRPGLSGGDAVGRATAVGRRRPTAPPSWTATARPSAARRGTRRSPRCSPPTTSWPSVRAAAGSGPRAATSRRTSP